MIPKIDLPQGFRAAGINSGVRRYRPDLGILLSDTPCAAAGVFTRNSLKAAPIQYCMKLLPSDGIRAIVVNSGQANAATGSEGLEDNAQLASEAAKAFGLKSDQVLISSTGVIGVRLPLDILVPAMSTLSRGLGDSINNFSLAIMTTDLVPKFMRVEVELSGGKVVIVGAAKGSGMIHPNMGTMLGFVAMDAVVDSKWLDRELHSITDETFNMISVDGETSTNDTVMALANGASKVAPKTDDDFKKLRAAFHQVCERLAISIARDGEGASKLITVTGANASSLDEARNAARLITTSPLIKSAVHGEDPNWGRILARLGQSGVRPESFEKLNVSLQGLTVFANGKPVKFDRPAARQLLHSDQISIDVDLCSGTFRAKGWGCDLTKRYVEINTEYS